MGLFTFIGGAVCAQDTIPPVISLNTPNTVYHQKGTPYTPVTPTVTDNFCPANQITLTLLSDVDVNVTGIYQDMYDATDPDGNTTRRIRTVVIGHLSNDYPASNYNIRVIPNPANEHITVLLADGIPEVGMKICSADGRTVYEKNGVRNGSIIDTGILETGVYTVLMDLGSMVIANKLLIQR